MTMEMLLTINNITSASNVNRYYYLDGYAGIVSTEDYTKSFFYTSGTLSNFYAYVVSNNSNTNQSFVLRADNSSTSVQFEVTAGVTGGFEDAANVYSITSGVGVNGQVENENGTGGCVWGMGKLLFTPATGNVARFMTTVDSSGRNLGTNTVTYIAPRGRLTTTTNSETTASCPILNNCTIKNPSIQLSTNARTTATSVTIRKNFSSSSLVISVAAGTTGNVANTTDSLSVTANDFICYECSAGDAATNFVVRRNDMDIIASDNKIQYIAAGTNLTTNAAGAVRYHNLNGYTAALVQTNTTIDVDFSAVFSNLNINLTSNILTNTTSFTLQKNLTNTALALSIPTLTAGLFAETSTQITSTAGDSLNYVLSPGAGSGNIVFNFMGILQDTAAAAPSAFSYLNRIEREILRGVGRGVMRSAA